MLRALPRETTPAIRCQQGATVMPPLARRIHSKQRTTTTVTSRQISTRARKKRPSALFIRADQQWDLGNARAAFRLFLIAARAGDANAQSRVGYCYDVGAGVRPNRRAAVSWYMRAYRRGDSCAAHNIGTVWRDAGDVRRADKWFQRAVRLGSDDSHIEIAKLYLHDDPRRAIRHLNRVLRSTRVCEADKTEARRLLASLTS